MVARPNPDRMTSYSASLFEAGKSRRMDCSSRSPVGVLRRSPTPDPDGREAPSTSRHHQSSRVDSLSAVLGRHLFYSGLNRSIFGSGVKATQFLALVPK